MMGPSPAGSRGRVLAPYAQEAKFSPHDSGVPCSSEPAAQPESQLPPEALLPSSCCSPLTSALPSPFPSTPLPTPTLGPAELGVDEEEGSEPCFHPSQHPPGPQDRPGRCPCVRSHRTGLVHTRHQAVIPERSWHVKLKSASLALPRASGRRWRPPRDGDGPSEVGRLRSPS